MFRVPDTFAQDPLPPGVGVGHGAFGGQLFRSHPRAMTAMRTAIHPAKSTA
jgi:hypothetical protein